MTRLAPKPQRNLEFDNLKTKYNIDPLELQLRIPFLLLQRSYDLNEISDFKRESVRLYVEQRCILHMDSVWWESAFSPPPPRAISLEPLFTILPSSSGPSRSALLARHAPGIQSDGAGRDGAMARRCAHTRSLRAARLRSRFSRARPPIKRCPYLLSPSALADTSTDYDGKEKGDYPPQASSGIAPPEYPHDIEPAYSHRGRSAPQCGDLVLPPAKANSKDIFKSRKVSQWHKAIHGGIIQIFDRLLNGSNFSRLEAGQISGHRLHQFLGPKASCSFL
ncbi:hypothetical protein B0H17DRAFT_1149579 [Mycena rosella]|uniref:Uncharacterized protein n=1 Tax=Mycena rosella TaxID=1033263 RepID=A0AAD7FT23_MYCRO|nr:hypothetical protein B0H17DRAFT_1149579 [Mycena rosella]